VSEPPIPDRIPHDEHAERAILGAVLTDSRRFEDLAGLDADEFYSPRHRSIYQAMCRIAVSGQAIDPVTVRSSLGPDFDGGAVYIASLLDDSFHSQNIRDYLRTVHQAAQDRRAMQAAAKYLEALGSVNGHGRDEVQTAQAALERAIASSCESGAGIEPDSPAEAATAAATPVCWAVEPLTTAKGVRVFSGLGASGKTTFAMFMSLVCINGGSESLGLSCDGGLTVAYLDAENSTASWWRKFYAVAAGLNIDPVPLVAQRRILRFGIRRHYLDDMATLRRIIRAVREAGCSEIIVDSMTAVHRADENNAGQMRRFFDESVFRLRDEVLAGVTILHHARKPPEGVDDVIHSMRGSSDIRNAVETHLSISRTGNTLRLDLTKQREAAECKPVLLEVTYEPGLVRYSRAIATGPKPDLAVRKNQAGDILDAGPDMSFSEALGQCIQAGVSRRTFIRAWKERHA
jgi:hypothetical protein